MTFELVETLRHRTDGCADCGLGTLGLPRCDGFGPLRARVAVVGINPSVRGAGAGLRGAFLIPLLAHAQRYPGIPRFARYADGLRGAERALWALVREAGVDLWDCYSTNAVKCATPRNRPPTAAEVEACTTRHLRTELESLPDLRTIICMGRVAGSRLGLSDFGQRVRVDGTNAEAVLLRHPNATLRRWTALREEGARLREAWPSAPAPPSSPTPTPRP